MLTGVDLLERIDRTFQGQVTRHFQFPFTRLHVISEAFRGIDEDDREQILAEKIEISVAALREDCNRLFFRLDLFSTDEPAPNVADRGHYWMRVLAEPAPRPDPLGISTPPFVHFYGYKGGQARSSVLCFLARVLASDGWRVLAVDVDAEAPSLDVLFGVRAPGMESSLLGVRAGLAVSPVRAVTPPQGKGYVDMLPFRPLEPRYDLDAAALAMEGNIHPPGLVKILQGVAKLAANYDVVLVDHRTGLASTVPPWIRHLPGPVVVFARMDGQWRLAKPHIAALWRLMPDRPGLLVSFKPDGEPPSEYKARVQVQADELLDELAAALATPEVAEDDMPTAAEISDHWVVWPYDATFNAVGVPAPERVGELAREAAQEIRRVLQLEQPLAQTAPPVLHGSGALDEGDLIQTQALRELTAPNNPYTFITGRKGTGKTRLLRYLAEDHFGEALLVAEEDQGVTGVQASNVDLKELAQATIRDPEQLWWTLLLVALGHDSTERAAMSAGIQAAMPQCEQSLRRARVAAEQAKTRRVFLIDGLETAFSRTSTFDFIGALFRVIAAVDSNPVFSDKVRIRVFVRTDLVARGFENLEQQMHGRTFSLRWDTQGILNFALSRIRRLPWFREKFPAVHEEIERESSRILEGALSENACDALLLRIFPAKLRHLNINMTTFLRTYFSDDPTERGSYYPRIYDSFLRIIAGEESAERRGSSMRELVDEHVNDELVSFAHATASENFLLQVRAELRNLVDLSEDSLSGLLSAFRDTTTPFDVERRCKELADRAQIDKSAVRQALDQMKTLGIFEDRPKYQGQWRAGRLFKTSLGMRYDRKRKDADGAP